MNAYELRLPASEQEGADRAAASRAQDCALSGDAGQTPAGVSVPLLWQADADPAATPSADGGQAARFGAGNGDGRVSQRLRQNGAPTGATAALGLKMPENRPATEKLTGSAGVRR